jgi:hypothetical protein
MRRIDLGIIGLVLLVLVSPAMAEKRLPTHRAVILGVGPFNDCTDGVTPETGMTVTNITCELYVESDAGGAGGALTRTAITLAASGSANDMVHVPNDVAGMYSLELTAAQLNFVGRARLMFTDPDVMAPAWEDLIVEPNNVYDSGVAGTDSLEVDAVAISGDSTAADALKDAADAGFTTSSEWITQLLATTIPGTTRTYTDVLKFMLGQ